MVSSLQCELGHGPDGLLQQSLISKCWLYCRPSQLPDRRHKHATALNMEIHQACEMFLLWSHYFQHLSGPRDTVACTGVGVGVQLCPLQMSNQTTLFFSRHCLYLSRGRTKNALDDTSLGASDKIHVVCAMPSRCPQVLFSPYLFPVPCPSWDMAFFAQPGSRLRFLFFTPCHLTISTQPLLWQ